MNSISSGNKENVPLEKSPWIHYSTYIVFMKYSDDDDGSISSSNNFQSLCVEDDVAHLNNMVP